MKFRFNKNYFLLAVLLFLVEIGIALFVHDNFVRPYIGDLLVVVFVYWCVMAVIDAPLKLVLPAVLLFAYTVEVLQYFHFVQRIGLGDSHLANVLFGNSFAWMDMLMYTIGAGIVWIAERARRDSSYLSGKK